MVSWVLFMQGVGLLISLQQFENGITNLNKANTFPKRSTTDVLMVLV